jgi:hypothetical protein
MPPETPERSDADDIERELEKLKGFGSTLAMALGLSAILVVLISVLLWLVVL